MANGGQQLTAEEKLIKGLVPVKAEFVRQVTKRVLVEAVTGRGASQESSKAAVQRKSRRQFKKERRDTQGTDLCIMFATKQCRFGDKCKFNHDVTTYAAAKPADLPGRCPFSALDTCPYGITCRWATSHNSSDALTQAMIDASANQGAEGTAGASSPAAVSNGHHHEASANETSESMLGGLRFRGDGSIPAATVQLPVQPTVEAARNTLSKDLQGVLRKSQYDFSKADAVLESLGVTVKNKRGAKKPHSKAQNSKGKQVAPPSPNRDDNTPHDAIPNPLTATASHPPLATAGSVINGSAGPSANGANNAANGANGAAVKTVRFPELPPLPPHIERGQFRPRGAARGGDLPTSSSGVFSGPQTGEAGTGVGDDSGMACNSDNTGTGEDEQAAAPAVQPDDPPIAAARADADNGGPAGTDDEESDEVYMDVDMVDTANGDAASPSGNVEARPDRRGGGLPPLGARQMRRLGLAARGGGGNTPEVSVMSGLSENTAEGVSTIEKGERLREEVNTASSVPEEQEAAAQGAHTLDPGSRKRPWGLGDEPGPSNRCEEATVKLYNVKDTRSMDTPMRLNSREKRTIDFRGKTYLAPLTTVGNLPYRRVCKALGVDITCGEMAMATNLLQGQSSEWALLKRHPSEDCFGVQVCGGFPDAMARCAQLLDENIDVDFVDINCGCPIDLVCHKGAGSSLMLKRRQLGNIVKSMSQVLTCPLTFKIRKGYYDSSDVAHHIIPEAPAWGAAAVTLHGRTRQQRYTKQADWEYISQCAADNPGVQLIGNGDLMSYDEFYHHLDQGVATVLIARGALIKPWIFTEIKERRHWDISAGERFDILKNFCGYGLEHWGSDSRGVETTRRFLLEWLSFMHRYVPVGLLEVVPQRLHLRPPAIVGRNDLETLMASDNPQHWVHISCMLLGPAPPHFVFSPKHKSNAWATTDADVDQAYGMQETVER